MAMIDQFLPYSDARGRAALAMLAHPETYPGLERLGPSDIVLKLFRFAGLGEYCVWAVAQRPAGYVVRRIVWDRTQSHRPEEISPVTFGCDSHVPTEVMERRLATLRTLSVPPLLLDDRIGLDGVRFGIECGTFLGAAALSWWSDAPMEWREIETWYEDLVAALEAGLPRRT
jgi:hypothetical protein